MYEIKKESWGVLLTFSGNFTVEEAQKYSVEIIQARAAYEGKEWGVIVDSHNLKIMMPGSTEILMESQDGGRKAGMKRSCVVLAAPLPIMQAKRMAKESGIYEWERYIDGQANANWNQIALDWVNKGIDPDKAELNNSLRNLSVSSNNWVELQKKKLSETLARKRIETPAQRSVLTAGKGQTATLLFSPEVARKVSTERWHLEQKGRFLEYGGYELIVPYNNSTEILADVLRYGSKVKVAAPQELVFRVSDEIASMGRLYKAS